MTTALLIKCIVLGVLGVAFHIFAIKAPAEKKRALAANLPFSFKEYIKTDLLAIIASLLAVGIIAMLVDEIIGYNPQFIRYAKFSFLFIGYTGSSLLVAMLGKFGNEVIKIVDVKTNIADAK